MSSRIGSVRAKLSVPRQIRRLGKQRAVRSISMRSSSCKVDVGINDFLVSAVLHFYCLKDITASIKE
ncbi:unnamed protein product [Oikopleura dioica]|uniref:Uncharacterized protein n=1 Tax=Oikopleura dioica TaxID=34765 RepID=E4XQ01_OIKDI|nr:unnamed protein product [Oikopleura dioica]